MELMNRAGTTIYLQAEPEELADRLSASKTVRPLIAGKSREELVPFIREHLSRREGYYESARVVYHTGRVVSKEDVHLTVSGLEVELKKRK